MVCSARPPCWKRNTFAPAIREIRGGAGKVPPASSLAAWSGEVSGLPSGWGARGRFREPGQTRRQRTVDLVAGGRGRQRPRFWPASFARFVRECWWRFLPKVKWEGGQRCFAPVQLGAFELMRSRSVGLALGKDPTLATLDAEALDLTGSKPKGEAVEPMR